MLASKISCLLVVSLAFLLGALLVMPSQGQNWATFQNKHIDSRSNYPPPTIRLYCDNMMRYRGLTQPLCKYLNTFIFEPANVIQQLCQNTWYPTSVNSTARFNLVDCTNVGGQAPNNCRYKGKGTYKYISITCERYRPVHYITSYW